VPLYVLLAYVVFAWLPERGVYSRRLALVWLVPVVLVSCRTMAVQRATWALKRWPVVTARGVFYEANRDRAAVLAEALPLLASSRSLVVMPEGLTLNYFARVRNPLSFHTFTPAEIDTPAAERAVMAELRARRPERVALVTRDVGEFGSRGFGVDYGLEIMAALREQYALERAWRTPRFTLVLLRLRR
jgi:hypothetical protein